MATKTSFLNARNTAQAIAPALKQAWSITSTFDASQKNGSFDDNDDRSLKTSAIASVKNMQKLQEKLNKEIEAAINNLNDSLKVEII